MPSQPSSGNSGQSQTQFAIIIIVLALLVIVAVAVFWSQTDSVDTTSTVLQAGGGAAARPTSAPRTAQQIAADFQKRIMAYYAIHGHWARTEGSFRFTDLGLNPADWSGPVSGLYWDPIGDRFAIENKPGDNLQVYVKDTNGNQLHVYDGWNIWCLGTGGCYYHSVGAGNEVDIATLKVVQK